MQNMIDKRSIENRTNLPVLKFIETPENQVSYSLVASPLNSGILYDDPAHRIWDPIEEVYDRRLHATANPGYSFLGWSSTPGLAFSPSPGSTVTEARPTEGSVVTANFAGQAFKLEAVYSSDRGQVSGQDNNFSYLTEATLVADPDDALGFVPETISRIQSYWKHYLEFGNTFAFSSYNVGD